MTGIIYVRDKVTDKLVAITALVGPSAYDIAVQEGFTGTRAEWLESLIGDVSEATVLFSMPEVREELVSGDTIPVLIGKLARLQADLKSIAFSGAYADLQDKPLIPSKVSDLANDKNYQTDTQVQAAIADLVNGSPEALDTLQELAAALGNDPNFATTVSNLIGGKASKSTTKTLTLSVANWVDDTANSGFWKYTVSDADIQANSVVVHVPASIADKTKGEEVGIDEYSETTAGNLVIFSESQPSENINIKYSIQD